MMLASPSWYKSNTPVTLDCLLEYCEEENVTVLTEVKGLCGLAACYDDRQRTVYISDRVLSSDIPAVLAHETFHIANGHSGHQSACIEAYINRLVAAKLIPTLEYAALEKETDGHVGSISVRLGQPYWLVKAFQQHYATLAPELCQVG